MSCVAEYRVHQIVYIGEYTNQWELRHKQPSTSCVHHEWHRSVTLRQCVKEGPCVASDDADRQEQKHNACDMK